MRKGGTLAQRRMQKILTGGVGAALGKDYILDGSRRVSDKVGRLQGLVLIFEFREVRWIAGKFSHNRGGHMRGLVVLTRYLAVERCDRRLLVCCVRAEMAFLLSL